MDAWLETPFKAPCPASDGCPWNNEIQEFLDGSLEEMERISQAALEKDDVAVESAPTPRSPIALLNNLLETIKLAPSIDDTSSTSLPSFDLLLVVVRILSWYRFHLFHLLNLFSFSSSFSSLSLISLILVLHSGLHSETRAGVGLGLTAIHAPVSSSSVTRAGVGLGLAEIHAPITSQLSTVGSTADFGDNTELVTITEQRSQESTEESKPKISHDICCFLAF